MEMYYIFYSTVSSLLLKKIHFLLKEQRMTIEGVKKILNNNRTLNLDVIKNDSISVMKFKNKIVKISNLIKSLKE